MPSYVNTDLDLASTEALGPLAGALASGRLFALHVEQTRDNVWIARFETDEQFSEAEPNIAAILSAVEALSEPLKEAWTRCSKREISIGYESGSENTPLEQERSAETLARMVANGLTMSISVYGPSAPNSR